VNRFLKWTCPTALLLVSGIGLASDPLKVAAQVDKTEVSTGQTLIYAVTIAGSIKTTPKIELTSFDGFQVISKGQSQSFQVRSGQAQSVLTLTYTLAPIEPGTHTLGPVKVEYQGQQYQTAPIEIKVVPGPAREPGRRPGAPRLDGGVVL